MDNLFRPEVLKYKTTKLEGIVLLIQPPIFYRLTLLILTIVIASLIFLSLGQYTRKEQVDGIIEPDKGLLRIKAKNEGVITEILVSEGEYVEAGEPLLRIASAKHSIQKLELNQALLNQYQFQLNSLEEQIPQQQLQGELVMEQLYVKKTALEQLLKEHDIKVITFKERSVLNKQIIEQTEALKGTGYISELELKRQRDSFLILQQESSTLKSERISLENELLLLINNIKQQPLKQQELISKLELQKADLLMQLASIEQQSLGEIRAPKSGIISGLVAKTGKAVSIGQNVLSLLPENSRMQAVIYVPTSAFGFIGQGQTVRLRYHAFPYEKFGIYYGTTEEISNTVILPEEVSRSNLLKEPAYRVVVSLNDQNIQAYGKAMPLRAGMKFDADVVIEERSLIHWLFDPVFSIKGQL